MQYRLSEEQYDLSSLLRLISESEHTYLKFLSANDLGLTGSHQAGLYISRDAWPLFFDRPGESGSNKEAPGLLRWPDGSTTKSVFKWYGSGGKSEYRLTRSLDFFKDREESFLGSLFILLKNRGEFSAFVLNSEGEIDSIMNFFGITPADTNCLLRFDLEERMRQEAAGFFVSIGKKFPDTEVFAKKAQEICRRLYRDRGEDPDETILRLMKIEYALFRFVEQEIYGHLLSRYFSSVDELLSVSLEINNRRKSRAGISLELHLSYLFDLAGLAYSRGETTEGNKRPDFIFPGIDRYRNPGFPRERLFFLGAKTTCKDRWRQIINEADRIPLKHLFTLQQGFSSSQLNEMHAEGVVCVLPVKYHRDCKIADRSRLVSLKEFIELVRNAGGEAETLFKNESGLPAVS